MCGRTASPPSTRRWGRGSARAHARGRVPRRVVEGQAGLEGVPVDWWYYEDLKRPLLRVDSAVGVPRDGVTMKGVTFEDMRPGSTK